MRRGRSSTRSGAALLAALGCCTAGCVGNAEDDSAVDIGNLVLAVDVAAVRPQGVRFVVLDREATQVLDETVAATGPTVELAVWLPPDTGYLASMQAVGLDRECTASIEFEVPSSRSLIARSLRVSLHCTP